MWLACAFQAQGAGPAAMIFVEQFAADFKT
jgi:hypothetical protein